MRDFIVIKKGCQPRTNTVNAGLVEAVAVDIDKVPKQFHHIVLLLVQPFDNRFTHLFPLSALSFPPATLSFAARFVSFISRRIT